MEEERFKTWERESRKLILSDVNELGVLFQVRPFVGLDMDPSQIRAELKVANIKLDEAMDNWITNTKEIIRDIRFFGKG